MSQHHIVEASPTFHDVAAWFSKEEWKLLHEWQTELYNNVMKEIHQALISLGPLISNSIFSLRAKDDEDVCSLDHQDSERPHSADQSPTSDTALVEDSGNPLSIRRTSYVPSGDFDNTQTVSSCLTEEGDQYIMEYQDCAGNENISVPIEQKADLAPVVPFIVKNEDEMCSMEKKESMIKGATKNHPRDEVVISVRSQKKIEKEMDLHEKQNAQEGIPGPAGPVITSVFSLGPFDNKEAKLKKESKPEGRHTGHKRSDPDGLFRTQSKEPPHLNNPKNSDERQRKDCGNTEFPLIETGTHLSKEEEPVTIFIDHCGVEIGESSINQNPGDATVNRRKKDRDSLRCSEITPECKAILSKSNTICPQISESKKTPRSRMWSERYQELRGEKSVQCESNFSNPTHFNLPQGNSAMGISDEYKESESRLTNSPFSKDYPKNQQNQGTYTCAQADNSHRLEGEFTKHKRSISERPYACNQCDAIFFQKNHLVLHHRIHSGDKPFMCTFCQKRFNRKYYLVEHLRIHTGERPYKCTECEKNFIQKSHLNEHRRKNLCGAKQQKQPFKKVD